MNIERERERERETGVAVVAHREKHCPERDIALR